MMLDVNKPYFGVYSFYVPFAPTYKGKSTFKEDTDFLKFSAVLVCASGKIFRR